MKAFTWIAFFVFLLLAGATAQTPISGVINQYTTVLEIDDLDCLARLEVADTTGFSVGMDVILIQMQGATIDESNTATFGSFSLGEAGLYEKNEIDSVAAGQVFLKKEILHNYDIDGKVQLVTMPAYVDALITSKLTAKSWDGETGGILAFSVTNELTMNAVIDVSGKGFRGGIAQTNLPNDCSWFTTQNDYYYNLSSWRGAAKGEGIAALISGKEAGKGPQSNGGGGGNDHNSGGGGGANVTFGGAGGENNEPSTFGCKGQHPGIGGKALPQLNDRFYLGGGGGAGHGNNEVATNGGNGGGILIMEVNSLITNGFQILAHGESVMEGGGDGGGGGGAGGTMVLFVNQVNGPLLIEAVGGAGGSIDNNGANRCHGPGGGGSGGVVAGAFPFTSGIEITGGAAGFSFNSAACSNSNNSAMNGQAGLEVDIFQLNEGADIISEINLVSQPLSKETCPGDTLSFALEITGNADFQWQVDQGGGFMNVMDGALYNGASGSELNINGAMSNMTGWIYRCIVSNSCEEIISEEALLEVFPELTVDPGNQTVVFCEGDSEIFGFSASGQGLQFQWQLDTGNGFNDLADNSTYSGTNTQFLEISDANIGLDGYTYQSIVSDTCGQEIVSGSFLLLVEAGPSADFSYSINGSTVSFLNQSNDATSYLWDFGDNSGTSNLTDPEHDYLQNGIYIVQLIVTNNCGSDTLELDIEIDSENFPDVAFSSSVVEGCAPLIVQFTDESTDNIQSWNWSFAGGDPASSSVANPSVTYWNPGNYDVILEVENTVGSSSNIFENYISVLQPLFASFNYTVDENTVDFTNTSPGGLTYQWDFGDGSNFSQEENPNHSYNQPGVYLVTLVITNAACGGAVTIPVEVFFTTTKDLEDADWINIFPNPVQDKLQIEFLQQANFKSIKLYNALGRCVLKEDLSFETTHQADLSNIAKGIYFLELRIQDQVFVKKLLKL